MFQRVEMPALGTWQQLNVVPAQNIMLEQARAQEFAAIQNKIAADQNMLNAASIEQMRFEQAQREFAASQQSSALKAALESYQQQQMIASNIQSQARG